MNGWQLWKDKEARAIKHRQDPETQRGKYLKEVHLRCGDGSCKGLFTRKHFMTNEITKANPMFCNFKRA